MSKADRGMRNRISSAIIAGNCLGKPTGILHPAAGIPICETGANTPAGQVSWQDLVMMRYSLAPQYQAGATFWMNANTFALLSTMSDAMNRVSRSRPSRSGS